MPNERSLRSSVVAEPLRLRLFFWQRRLTYAVFAMVALSGLAWLVLHYFFSFEGEFGPQNHPLQHTSLVIHGASAYAAIWVFGMIVLGHVRVAWLLRRNRFSGLACLSILGMLMASGWSLYYAGAEWLRSYLSVAHWLIGILSLIVVPMHVLLGRRATHKSGVGSYGDTLARVPSAVQR